MLITKTRTTTLFRHFLLAMLTLSMFNLSMAQTIGPQPGALVIVGGGMQDPTILQRFAELAGGLDESIVIIPTAGGGVNYDEIWPGVRQVSRAGAGERGGGRQRKKHRKPRRSHQALARRRPARARKKAMSGSM